jgi:hypothetical protein
MSIGGRLNRLMPVLTAKERGILVLRALQSGTPEDPSWRSTMPREQSSVFNHYIFLMNACNIYLPLYITMVEGHVQQLWLRLYWMEALMTFGNRLWELGKFVAPAMRGAAKEAMQGTFPVVELPWDGEEHPNSWLNVTEDMYKTLRLWLVSLWQEVRSIDAILDEVALEFDGEDPLRPIMRKVLEKARRDLTLLHGAFNKDEPLELPEPDDEAMTLARKYFDNGYRLMANL